MTAAAASPAPSPTRAAGTSMVQRITIIGIIAWMLIALRFQFDSQSVVIGIVAIASLGLANRVAIRASRDRKRAPWAYSIAVAQPATLYALLPGYRANRAPEQAPESLQPGTGGKVRFPLPSPNSASGTPARKGAPTPA